MCCNLPAVGQSLGRAWIVLSLWGVHSNPFQRSPLSGRPFYGADQYGIEAGQTGKHIARAWQSSPVWYYIGRPYNLTTSRASLIFPYLSAAPWISLHALGRRRQAGPSHLTIQGFVTFADEAALLLTHDPDI
jgi:hypothetical protein